jgi:hypothetical protein
LNIFSLCHWSVFEKLKTKQKLFMKGRAMGFLYVIFSLLCPRLFLLGILIFTTWFSQAYQTVIWPLLGFFFMPLTTLAYMAAMFNNGGTVTGWWIVLIVFAVLLDLVRGGNASHTQSKSSMASWT